MGKPVSATDAFWRDRVIPCSNSQGYMILDNAGRPRPAACELDADHVGDHQHWILRWPQERWLCTTDLPKEIRELLDCVPILHRQGKTIPEILTFLANVFTDAHELVEIDSERTLKEILELKAELRADLELESPRTIAARA